MPWTITNTFPFISYQPTLPTGGSIGNPNVGGSASQSPLPANNASGTIGQIIGTIVGGGLTTGVGTSIPALPSTGVSSSSTGIVSEVQSDVQNDINSLEVTTAKELKTAAIWIALFIILAIGVVGLILPSDNGEYPVPIPAP